MVDFNKANAIKKELNLLSKEELVERLLQLEMKKALEKKKYYLFWSDSILEKYSVNPEDFLGTFATNDAALKHAKEMAEEEGWTSYGVCILDENKGAVIVREVGPC
jgi:hypothetical protein